MKEKKYISEIPELMKEWDWEANSDLDPSKLTIGSNKKACWKCVKCGGKWQTHICGRTGKENKHHTGCPYCASQKVLSGYNDLATKYPNIVKQWHPTKNILKPTEVMPGTSKKVWWICSKGHEYEQAVNARVLHPASCPICSGQRVAIGINDLQSRYPEVANEWLQNKNGNVTPTTVTWGSNKKFWWKCSKCGYEWQARVSDRTRDHNGCPACANKVLVKGFNDLATKFPDIAKEWHPTKNGDLKPEDVKYGSCEKVWLICSKGHEFLQSIRQRTCAKQGCSTCANQNILIGYNDKDGKETLVADFTDWHKVTLETNTSAYHGYDISISGTAKDAAYTLENPYLAGADIKYYGENPKNPDEVVGSATFWGNNDTHWVDAEMVFGATRK